MENPTALSSNLLKVISFNLKRDGFVGSKNRWAARKEAVASLIEQSGASIIGVQELLPKMKTDMDQRLKDYSIIGMGRYMGKNNYNDEHSDIIVKNNDAKINSHDTFWLSKKPQKCASRGLLALFPRICTVAEIYVKEYDCLVRVFNTHFDCISGFARVLGVRIILEYMSRYNKVSPMPTILMGDMNATPNNLAIQILRKNLHFYNNIHLSDVYVSHKTKEIHNTYHGFNGKLQTGKEPIDYIFVSDDFEVVDYEVCTENSKGQYPSDHFPIMATLRLKTC